MMQNVAFNATQFYIRCGHICELIKSTLRIVDFFYLARAKAANFILGEKQKNRYLQIRKNYS